MGGLDQKIRTPCLLGGLHLCIELRNFAASDMRVLVNFLFPREENLSVLSPPLQVVLYPDRDLLPNHTL